MKNQKEMDIGQYDYDDILLEALDRIRHGVQGSLEEVIEDQKGNKGENEERTRSLHYIY